MSMSMSIKLTLSKL